MLEHFLRQCWSRKERQALMNGLFLQVRWALFINPILARENWNYLRGLNYWPSSDVNLPLFYCVLVRVSGLTFSERLRKLYQGIQKWWRDWFCAAVYLDCECLSSNPYPIKGESCVNCIGWLTLIGVSSLEKNSRDWIWESVTGLWVRRYKFFRRNSSNEVKEQSG